MILLGYSNGSFVLQTNYFLGFNSYPQHVISVDFNQDNQLDIITVNSNNDSISILIDGGNGGSADPTYYSTKEDSQ